MKFLKFFLIAAMGGLLYSCQKEANFEDAGSGGSGTTNPGNTNQSITSDYDFVGVSAQTKTTVTVSDPQGQLKTVTTSNYTSANNSGTAKFTSNQMIYTNIAYSINMTAHVQLYLAGLLVNQSDIPIDIPPAPISGTEDFVKNTNDSLTFPRPIFVASNPYSSTLTPAPMGARISWLGDTLQLRIVSTLNGSISQAGIPANFSSSFDGVMKFKKK
jgi:hypothetical protein